MPMTVSWVTPIASGLSLVAGTGVAPVKIRPVTSLFSRYTQKSALYIHTAR